MFNSEDCFVAWTGERLWFDLYKCLQFLLDTNNGCTTYEENILLQNMQWICTDKTNGYAFVMMRQFLVIFKTRQSYLKYNIVEFFCEMYFGNYLTK